MNLVTANGSSMPYEGWVEITFSLAPPAKKMKELVIPLLILKGQQLSKPITGYNMIEQVMKQSEESGQSDESKQKRKTESDCIWIVIAYGLTAAEQKYYLQRGKLEFLALKWAITEKFRDYLYYAP